MFFACLISSGCACNYRCLRAISWLIYLREAKVIMHKVQAHSSGHRHATPNAMADALAGAAISPARMAGQPASSQTLPQGGWLGRHYMTAGLPLSVWLQFLRS